MRNFFLNRSVTIVVLLAVALVTPSVQGQALFWNLGFDEQGRVFERVDPSGRITRFDYSPSAPGETQVITTHLPDETSVTWVFSSDGDLMSYSDSQGEVTHSYDNRKRLRNIERSESDAIRCSYDDADRLVELKVGDYYRIAWSYDFLGRISEMETPAGRVRYEYQTGQGTVVRALPNGIKTILQTQANGRLEEITHGHFLNPDATQYTVLSDYKYGYDPEGRVAAIEEQSAKGAVRRHFSYDTMGRLIHATGREEYGYEYDLLGNRTKTVIAGTPVQNCSYDWAGRLTSVNGTASQYDSSGNLAELTIDGVTRRYHYNAEARLEEVDVSGEVINYTYDGFGRLLSRRDSNGDTRFILDPFSQYWQPLVIDRPNGKRTLVIWEGALPMALVHNGQVEWLLHDHLGSVRLIADDRGRVTEQRDYDPFGGAGQSTDAADLKPGFAGLFWDESASCYLTLARAYSPALGMFLQTDPQKPIPVGVMTDVSLYAYCGSDPLNLIDRDGMAPKFIDEWYQWWKTSFNPSYTVPYGDLPRDAIMDQVYQSAYRDAWPASSVQDGNVDKENLSTRAYFRARELRYMTPIELEKTFPDARSRPTAAELRNVENQLLNQMYVETGRYPDKTIRFSHKSEFGIPLRIFNAQRGAASARIARHITTPGWAAAHRIFETTHYRNRIDPNGQTLVQDPKTIPRQIMGVNTGERWVRAAAIAEDYKNVFKKGLGREYDRTPSTRSFDISDSKQPNPPNTRRDVYDPLEYASSWTPPPPPGGGGGGWGGGTTSPSPVGGVYLGGAGQMIDGLGNLSGIRVDENGNLVLVGEDSKDIKLPPLRIDDVVTVFRSVYIHGEGPSVTIDPHPDDPEKSSMIVRHGKATEETYVGWVLYQADRLMKGFGQGIDNITEKDIETNVSGYAEVLDTIYFGSGDPFEKQKQGNWERFWIVPAATDRFETTSRDLTLFDVPLKLKTQKMKWVGKELVDDLKGKSSIGASAFTTWFTENYDELAEEQYLMPPSETGLTEPVPVFSELRRIALLTAIAEQLRDKGVSLPFWMHDYEVTRIPVDRFTPGMEVTWTRHKADMIETARIFGGVELSPESKSVNTYSSRQDVSDVSPERRAQVDRSISIVRDLEPAVAEAVSPVTVSPLSIHDVILDADVYRTVTVPGSETQVLNPCRLNETDIRLKLAGGASLGLPRYYNSFFDPKGPWGRGWSMDLPRLVQMRVPMGRSEDTVSFALGYELITPLNSLNARFLGGLPVVNFLNPDSPTEDTDSPFFGIVEGDLAIFQGAETRKLLWRNGLEWHFTAYGSLVAEKDGPRITVYERGTAGEISRIISLIGNQLVGEITLEYNDDTQLTKATGVSHDPLMGQTVEVSYTYNDLGRLGKVISANGTLAYAYDDSKVTSISWQSQIEDAKPEVLYSFEYNALGQVVSESAEGVTIAHSITPSPNGVVASTMIRGESDTGIPDAATSVTYDRRMRPIEAKSQDGSSEQWSYHPDGTAELTLVEPGSKPVRVHSSADGRTQTVHQGDMPEVTVTLDDAGRVVNLLEGESQILKQEWRADGQLGRVTTPINGTTYQYDDHSQLSSILLHPEDAEGSLSEWQETTVDRLGRPVQINDFTGLKVMLDYNQSGELSGVLSQKPDGNYGYQFERDDQGRIRKVNSSWGNTEYDYDAQDEIKSATLQVGDRTAQVELSEGIVRTITGFDGGQTRFAYSNDSLSTGMPRSITCANGLVLHYEYDGNGRPSSVLLGSSRRVRFEYDLNGLMVAYVWEPAIP